MGEVEQQAGGEEELEVGVKVMEAGVMPTLGPGVDLIIRVSVLDFRGVSAIQVDVLVEET